MDPQVEQIEIIERTVEERRGPVVPSFSTAGGFNHQPPSSHIRTSTERFVTGGHLTNGGADDANANEERYKEPDFSMDNALLYQSGRIPLPPPPPLQHSTPEKSDSRTGINNYGFDVQEAATGEGLHHDSSNLASQQRDRSLVEASMFSSQGFLPPSGRVLHHESTVNKTDYTRVVTTKGTAGQYDSDTSGELQQNLQSILKNPDQSWKQLSSSAEDSSLTRKNSYKKMQETQLDSAIPYAGSRPSSNATIITKGSSLAAPKAEAYHKWSGTEAKKQLGNIFDSSLGYAHSLLEQIRAGEWSPRLFVTFLLALLLLFIGLFILWQLFSAIFLWNSTYTFYLYPPLCEECLRQNKPHTAQSNQGTPSKLFVHQSSSTQAQFELWGNPPFRSNSLTIVDFATNFIAVADHALTDAHGRHTTCFLMQLDTNTLPDLHTLMYAVRHSPQEVRTQFGWQEYWQFNPEPIEPAHVQGKFREEIIDCKTARWYFLKPTVHTKDESCSGCYDFCLPDYAVQRRQKYEDDAPIGIRRLNCFRLYVPEWSSFGVSSDETGGHWDYPPRHQAQYTRRDQHGNWANLRQPTDRTEAEAIN